ncbi:hypothetical protein OKW41_006960 [Paraburkholderia sp. UCT70]|uniref:hypothetical protein n=1 Tax=Paraburkholderia sp. UCT70 TaxID=2991068 RepID=UPI003D1C070D
MLKTKLSHREILELACALANGSRPTKPVSKSATASANSRVPPPMAPRSAIGRISPSTAGATFVYAPKNNLRSALVAATPEGGYQHGIKGYKYLARKYVAGLLSGSTRLGTLHDYRREELGHGIADPNEGRKRLHHQKTDFTITGETADGDAFRHMGFEVLSGGSVKFSGIQLIREVDHPDVFVWCCAGVLDSEIMTELDGAEACVEISDLGGFFREITMAIGKLRPVKFLGMQEIQYLPIDQPWNGVDLGLSAAFSKDRGAYGGQREIRAIWAPLDDDPIEPLILQADGLSHFCKEVDLPK